MINIGHIVLGTLMMRDYFLLRKSGTTQLEIQLTYGFKPKEDIIVPVTIREHERPLELAPLQQSEQISPSDTTSENAPVTRISHKFDPTTKTTFAIAMYCTLRMLSAVAKLLDTRRLELDSDCIHPPLYAMG